jgi:hypothetical protein
MNIVLDIANFQLCNIIFLENKRNIIMDGTFSKIIYTNAFISLNSIYFYFPIEIQHIEKVLNKNIMKFYPSSVNNMPLVQELSKIEYRIIEYYKQINKIEKKTVCLLTKQLYSGNLKIYKDYSENSKKCSNNNIKYIIKLSGIWETYDEIGITYKIIESYPV